MWNIYSVLKTNSQKSQLNLPHCTRNRKRIMKKKLKTDITQKWCQTIAGEVSAEEGSKAYSGKEPDR